MSVPTLEFRDGALVLLDQRKLPHSVEWVRIETARECARAIREMVVRGVFAIGCAAAFGVALAARQPRSFDEQVAELRVARPTAVNLGWAIDRMLRVAPRSEEALLREARAILA